MTKQEMIKRVETVFEAADEQLRASGLPVRERVLTQVDLDFWHAWALAELATGETAKVSDFLRQSEEAGRPVMSRIYLTNKEWRTLGLKVSVENECMDLIHYADPEDRQEIEFECEEIKRDLADGKLDRVEAWLMSDEELSEPEVEDVSQGLADLPF